MKTGKILSIAVLGPSTMGKTTYIASLCEESVRDAIHCRTKQNNKGQTKISCYYHFTTAAEDTQSFDKSNISSVFIYREKLVGDVGDINLVEIQKLDGCTQRLLRLLGITDERLRECVMDENLLVCISTNMSIDKITDLDKQEYSEILHHIVLNVKGSDEFERYLKDEGIPEIIIRDVRGFGDDYISDGEMESMQNDSNKRASYYGYEDVDAIILFNITGGTFSGGRNVIYMRVLEDALALKPVIVLERSDLLRFFMGDNGESYTNIMDDRTSEIWETDAFKTIDSVIDHIIQKNKAAIYSDIIKKYIRYLFLPEVKMQKEEYRSLYLEAVIGSLNYLLQNVKQFQDAVVKVSSYCKPTLIQNLSERFASDMYLSSEFTHYLEKGNWWAMVGPNGGLTTWISGSGRVGQKVIDVMDSIYSAVRNCLCDRWKIKLDSNKSTEDQQQEILIYSIIEKFLHSYEKFLDWRSSINPTARESIVRSAFDQTHDYIQKNKGVEIDVRRCFVNCVMQYIKEGIESMD